MLSLVPFLALIAAPPETYQLDNGLKVILQPDDFSTQVTVLVRYDVGSVHDPYGYENLAHLVEHLVHRGTRHLPGTKAVELLVEVGATHQAHTEPDATTYFVTLDPTELPLALWIESERMAFALEAFTEETLASEKRIVRREHLQRNVEQLWALDAIIAEHAYPEDHPLQRAFATGDESAAVTLSDAQSFFQTYYRPDNATLVVTGRFRPDDAKARIDRWFGPIGAPPTPPPDVRLPRVVFEGTGRLEVGMFMHIPRIRMLWHIPCEATDCIAAAALLRIVLAVRAGDALSARKLAWWTSVDLARRGSQFMLEVVVSPRATPDRVIRALKSILTELWTTPLSETDLVPLSVGAQTDWLLAWRDLEDRARHLAVPRDMPPPDIEALIARIPTIDSDELRTFVRRWVRIDRCLLTVTKPHLRDKILEEPADLRFVSADAAEAVP